MPNDLVSIEASAERRGADVRGDPQQRPGTVPGRAELALQHVVPGQFHGGAVDRGDLQAPPRQAAPRSASGTAASSSKIFLMTCSPSSFLACEYAAPVGDIRARRAAQAGRPERRRQHAVVPARRGTGTRPARRPRSSSRSAPGRTYAPPGPRAARGRSRHRRAAAPAGPPGPGQTATASRSPARTRSGRPSPRPPRRRRLPPARAGWTAKRQAWQTEHATKLPADGMGVDNPRPTWSFVSFLVPPRPVTPP